MDLTNDFPVRVVLWAIVMAGIIVSIFSGKRKSPKARQLEIEQRRLEECQSNFEVSADL